jgi:hypothetical protein
MFQVPFFARPITAFYRNDPLDNSKALRLDVIAQLGRLRTSASAPKPISQNLTSPKSATLSVRIILPSGSVSIFWLGCQVRSRMYGACEAE